MNRATKSGVVEITDFNRADLRTWVRDPEGDRYLCGVWRTDDRLERWVPVPEPPLPWRHREGIMLAFLHPDGKSVIVSGSIQEDGRPWLHVSVARQNRMPSYKDLAEVKELFIGRERQAIQLFPPATELVNLHPWCLHLWCALGGDGLPDFTRGGASL